MTQNRQCGGRAASVQTGSTAVLGNHSGTDELGELDLTGHAGVLLGPQRTQSFRNPAVDGPEPVQPRVTGSAERDQGRRDIAAPSVMDHQ